MNKEIQHRRMIPATSGGRSRRHILLVGALKTHYETKFHILPLTTSLDSRPWQQSSALDGCLAPKKVVGCDHKYWGDGDSNPIADPNPRLHLLIEAARRGAKVRVLLDGLFDEPEALRSNHATAQYLATVATAEGLDLVGAVGNPTGGGIHAKWLLARINGVTWSTVGNLNGGEISHKVNREVVLMVDHPLVYDRLLEVFLHDWALVTR